MARRDYKDLKYATPQLPARGSQSRRLHDEKFVRVTPPPAALPVTMRDVALPEFSSITAIERDLGFRADEVIYRGLVVRRLLYRDVPVFYAALGECAPSLVKLQAEVNRRG